MGMANVGNIHLDAAAILRGAHDKIDRGGWIQRAEKQGNAYCMIGAMKASDGTKPAAYAEAQRIVMNLTGVSYIQSYNDATGRTKAEVLDVLLAAANCERDMA